MASKKVRSRNFTETEKQTLLEIANRFCSVLESKKTDVISNKQKEKTWLLITNEYNASATSGNRDWRQLKHLYVTTKQQMRKQIASENRNRYLNMLQEAGVTEAEAVEAKQVLAKEKREIKKTGGGGFSTSIDGQCDQVLAVIAEQTKPLPNPFDNAAEYFDDEIMFLPLPATSYSPAAPTSPVETSSPLPSTSTASGFVAEPVIVAKPRKQANKVKLLSQSSEKLKRIYFAKKIRNAELQFKNEQLHRQIMLKKYNMEMLVLKEQLKKARNS